MSQCALVFYFYKYGSSENNYSRTAKIANNRLVYFFKLLYKIGNRFWNLSRRNNFS